ncbi:MAG: HAD hydrolase-like protein [Acidimicrobiales bacterium]
MLGKDKRASAKFNILARLSTIIRSGARFIGTNEDPTHPSPAGLLPGTGALLAAVAAAAHTAPIVAGKPHDAMVRLVKELVGPTGDIEVVIGDRLSTDKVFASSLGAEFGLVFSDATSLEMAPGEALARFSASSLLEVVTLLKAVSD